MLCGADKTRVRLPDWERFLFPRRVFWQYFTSTSLHDAFLLGALSPAKDYFFA